MKATFVTPLHALKIIILSGLLFWYGCGTAGKNFDESKYKNIVAGTTTQKEVHSMLGSPFKKGIQNGYSVWTYEYNFYNSIGDDVTKDMAIVFNRQGVVKSHQMMTNRPDTVDKKK